MAAFDFSGSFSGIHRALGQIGQQNELAFKQSALAALGQDIQSGNYAGAAQKAIAAGDAGLGVSLLGLGQKAGERDADASLLKGLFGNGGGTAAPAAAPLGQGVSARGGSAAARPFDRPVQVAETEEDVARLEADMAQRSQIGYGNPQLPAGMRNNNPGNIKFVGLGQAPGVVGPSQNTDQGDPQAVFNSPEAGMAAAHSLALRKYQGGKRTANDLIAGQNGWTPGNTDAAANIARNMGLKPTDDLRLDDPQRAQAFLRALTAQEHGRAGATYPQEMIAGATGAPGGQAPVQVAQAPGPTADMPAQGASAAQGFVIPGTGEVIDQQTLASNPRLRNLTMALGAARGDAAKATIGKMLELEIADAKQRREDNKLLSPEQEAQKIRLAQAGRTTITNANTFDGKGESKFNEALGTAQAKRWNSYIEEGDVAQGRIADIQTLRDASRRLGSQGSSANLKATIGPFAESLGIAIEGLPDIQLYESITNRLAPTLRAPGSGSTSDIEFKGFQRAIGPLSNNPAAREMILDTFEAASRNDLARSEIASRLAEGQINRGQAEKEIRALPNPLEGFRKYREANPDQVGQAIKESAQRQALEKNGPPKIASPEQARSLPSGTEFIDPNGVKRRVP